MGRVRIRRKDVEHQRSVASFFPAMNEVIQWKDSTIQQHPNLAFRHQAMWFRYDFEDDHVGWHYYGTWKDYCFYSDAEYREFKVYAPADEGKEVASLTLDDEYYICGLYTEIEYRRQGIATHLIEVANAATYKRNGPGLLALMGNQYGHTRQHPDERYLTEEGNAVIYHCLEQGILQDDQLIGNTPYNSSQESSPHKSIKNL